MRTIHLSILLGVPLAIALGFSCFLVSKAQAAEQTCSQCGCCSCLRKVCVCKPIEKEITKTCWDVKCEDVCVPGCSELCCEKCQQDKCGCWTYNIWKPSCVKIKTRHIPVKTEVKRKVPSFEWVVEYRCANCCGGACCTPDAQAAAAGAQPAEQTGVAVLPAPPVPAAPRAYPVSDRGRAPINNH